jgi:hypothetical protein
LAALVADAEASLALVLAVFAKVLASEALVVAVLAASVAVVAALLAVTCLLFTSVAKEFASAPNVGNAPKNSSALVLKLAGSCLVGGVGSNVIAMFFLYVKLSISMLHLLNVG